MSSAFRRWEDEQRWAFANLPKHFTNLLASGFQLADVTSPNTPRYNCIAYAAKDETRPWWPMPHSMGGSYYYWPDILPRENPPKVKNFYDAFETLGFKICGDGKFEPGFEKVAIYVDSNDVPTHMAREDGDGVWYSKLGDGQDIRHHHLSGVQTTEYGDAKYFMRRQLPGVPKWKRFLMRAQRFLRVI